MTTASWMTWAMLSAVFAALTAVFAKLGVSGVDPDLATLIRTAIVLLLLVPLVWATGKWSDPFAPPPRFLQPGFLPLPLRPQSPCRAVPLSPLQPLR